MDIPSTIRLYGTAPDSIVDGPGLRFAVFTQGCSHGCPGCHNADSQPACGGTVRSVDDLVAEIAANKLAQGVTISGGEPFEQASACAELAQRVRSRGLSVWTYTGYRYEDLMACATSADATLAKPASASPKDIATPASCASSASLALPLVDAVGARALLAATDVLVDGPFVQARHSYSLSWRGSSNQRLIDIPATTTQGHIVLWENQQEFPQKPASW